jgi:hypothetical protein
VEEGKEGRERLSEDVEEIRVGVQGWRRKARDRNHCDEG